MLGEVEEGWEFLARLWFGGLVGFLVGCTLLLEVWIGGERWGATLAGGGGVEVVLEGLDWL